MKVRAISGQNGVATRCPQRENPLYRSVALISGAPSRGLPELAS